MGVVKVEGDASAFAFDWMPRDLLRPNAEKKCSLIVNTNYRNMEQKKTECTLDKHIVINPW